MPSKFSCFLHGSGGPEAGELPSIGDVTNLSTQSLFLLDFVHMLAEVPHQGGLPVG